MIKDFVKNVLYKLGVNRAVFYYLLGRGFPFLVSPITILLIATYFSPSEQGYYYTFSSLLALSIFFELGLGVVITQFASHEYAGLSWDENGGLSGDISSLSRLISLLRKSLKWYAVIVAICLVLLIPSGLLLFGSKPDSHTVRYGLPWILLIIFFGLGTWVIPLTSVIEGCGRVAEIQRLRVMQSVVGIICSWIIILVGGGLFSISFQFMAYSCVAIVWFIYNHKGLLLQILKHNLIRDEKISWFKEIFPIQWRVAVTSLAAYFINFLFVPLLFIYQGSIVAGKMGMSLKLSGMVFMISMAWVSTRVPFYGALVKKKKYKELDRIAVKGSLIALLFGFLLSVVIVLCITFLRSHFAEYAARFLSGYAIVLLCVANLASGVMFSISGYLRAYKKEPLMVLSVFLAVIVAISSFLSAKYFNAEIMVIAFTAVFLFMGVPGAFYILFRKRRQWHQL